MIAKRFDAISLASLSRASLFGLLLTLPLLFRPLPENTRLELLNWSWSWPFEAGVFLLPLLVIISAELFNLLDNRSRQFAPHNHLLVISSILAVGLLAWAYTPTLLVLPFWIIFLNRWQWLLLHKDPRVKLFDLGFFLGVLSLWNPVALFLIPLVLASLLFFLPSSWRQWLAFFLGLSALFFLLLSLEGLLQFSCLAAWARQFPPLGFQLPHWHQGMLIVFVTQVFLVLFALSQYPRLFGRANNQQRQALQFWYFMLLLGGGGWLVLPGKEVWLLIGCLAACWLLARIMDPIIRFPWRSLLYLLLLIFWLAPWLGAVFPL